MLTKCLAAGALVLVLVPTLAAASETVAYSYDAKGRLTTVTHSGSVNNNIVANYTFDPADNRTNLTVSGSRFSTPLMRVVTVPLRGGTPVPVP